MIGRIAFIGILVSLVFASLQDGLAPASQVQAQSTLFRFASEEVESAVDARDGLIAFELDPPTGTVARVYQFDGKLHGSIDLPACASRLATFAASTNHSLVVACQHVDFVDVWTFDLRTCRELARERFRGLYATQTVGNFATFGELGPLRLSVRSAVTLAQLAVIRADIEGPRRSLVRFFDGRFGLLQNDAANVRPVVISALRPSPWAVAFEWYDGCGPVAFERGRKRLETFTSQGSIAQVYRADKPVAVVACGTKPSTVVGLTYASGSDGTVAADIGFTRFDDRKPKDRVIMHDDTNELGALVVDTTVFVHSHDRVSAYDASSGKMTEKVSLPGNKGLFLRGVSGRELVDIFCPSARFELLEPVLHSKRRVIIDVR